MKGIILAAGRGSRMGPLTKNSHKSLCTLHGFKLIDIQIQKFKLAGIDEIGIITGYNEILLKTKKVRKFFHNNIWERSNMVYSLSLAKNFNIWEASLIGSIFAAYQVENLGNIPIDKSKILSDIIKWKR